MSHGQALQRYGVGTRYSEAAAWAGVVYLSGMVPACDEADITAQTQDVLDQVQAQLLQAGSDKSRLLQVQIYLSDIADIAAMNAVWDKWVVPGSAPPRATVQAALANAAWKIEIVVTAAVCD